MPQSLELSDDAGASVLIIGIDPGTTGAKLAFLRAFETYNGDKIELTVDPRDRIQVIGNFPGHRQSYLSTLPTCLIYDEETGRLVHWGHEAVNNQSRHGFNPRSLITTWKIKLLEGSLQNSLGKPPQCFATDFFSALTDHLFHGPRSALLGHFGGGESMTQFSFFDVVIAMPPGWSHAEHTLFTDAAKKALDQIPKVRVSTVSETECALRSWQSQEGKYLKIEDGEVTILMDLGGGTACLSSFRYEGERWSHLESYSLRAGSEVAAAAFRHEFRTRLERARFQGSPTVFHYAQQAFDMRKMEIGTDDEDEFWLCPVEGLIYSEKHAFRDGHMLFTREQLKSYFQPLQENILGKLDDMVTRTKPKYCVLAGAYSRNDLFLKQLDKENERYKMDIFSPENQADIVATGACRTRVEGDCRLVHGSKISVGILTFRAWDEVKVKNPEVHHFHLDGDRRRQWCRVITWIVKKGDMADPDRAVIDHDGNTLRKRHFKSGADLIISEVILTTEAHPGQDRYTALTYGTHDAGWQNNKEDFEEKYKMPLNVRGFKLDLTYKLVENQYRSKLFMKDAALKRDSVGKYFEYKYYLTLSQTDCRMSLQVFPRFGNTRKMLLQYSISAFEVESTELQDEQEFAKHLSQIQRANNASEESSTRGKSTARNTRCYRVGAANNLPSQLNPRNVLRSEREDPPEPSVSVDHAAEEISYQAQQVTTISTPDHSIAPALLVNNGVSHESLPNADIEVSDNSNNIFDTATAALRRLRQPNHEQLGLYMSKIFNTSTPRRATRTSSACRSTPNPANVTPASCLLSTDTLEDFDIFPEDPCDLDYIPGKKFSKKHATPSAKEPGTRSKRIRSK